MKYTKQDWIDGKVAIKGNPKKKDKANAFFRSVYPETQKDAMFNRNRFYTYLDDSGLICWDIHYPVTLPTCDIDDIIWEDSPEKHPENYPENSIEKTIGEIKAEYNDVHLGNKTSIHKPYDFIKIGRAHV